MGLGKKKNTEATYHREM